MRRFTIKGKALLPYLHLEEYLWKENIFSMITMYTTQPYIVLGLGQKVDQVLHMDKVVEDGIEVVRRATGGGTVYIDANSWLVSMVGNITDLHTFTNPDLPSALSPYPKELMNWMGSFYGLVFSPYGDYSFQENDYCFGACKFGGSAAKLSKGSFIHHNSFLYHYDTRKMSKYLKNPPKQPLYRNFRDHDTFLTTLSQQDQPPQGLDALEHQLDQQLRECGQQLIPDELDHYWEGVQAMKTKARVVEVRDILDAMRIAQG